MRYWDYLVAAKVNHAEGRYVASWHNLFEAEFLKDEAKQVPWKQSTSRQKEVQRLWQLRGTLERTKANLQVVYRLVQPQHSQDAIIEAMEAVNVMIENNKAAFKTISQRIPNDDANSKASGRNENIGYYQGNSIL